MVRILNLKTLLISFLTLAAFSAAAVVAVTYFGRPAGAQQTVLLSDDFSSYPDGAIPTGWTASPTFKVRTVSTNPTVKAFSQIEYHGNGYAQTHVGDTTWTDVDINLTSNYYGESFFFVDFRKKDANNFYRLEISHNTSAQPIALTLKRFVNSVGTLIGYTDFPPVSEAPDKINIKAVGNRILISLNNQYSIEATDTDPTAPTYGEIGIGSSWRPFDIFNIKVSTAAPFVDATPVDLNLGEFNTGFEANDTTVRNSAYS